ncbi:uncharacterized protein ColSpa_09143 [Colletotrichum spaethianum]|uniref:Rhodopsin domain-containing protein n=1 Tax=Colletotrichum spaethianum TaxID=700344 RepID=A0AA37UQL4_9PEZI|nr:uncharacterized protein ColSpa_09143 [Colletotrichum spaethianum]GKT48962.1 hypothetical protein ColSpa_09143 [Colletotrichum spaethianum]
MPPGIDLNESKVNDIVGALGSTWALAGIAVTFRFLGRRLKRNDICVEDWLILISLIAYIVTLSTIKLSILLFYWRIFSARFSIKVLLWFLAGVNLMWALIVLSIAIFQCFPAQYFWMRYAPVPPSPDEFTCTIDPRIFFKANSIPSIVADAFIVILPMPYVWTLQMPRSQRIAVIGIFALGAL